MSALDIYLYVACVHCETLNSMSANDVLVLSTHVQSEFNCCLAHVGAQDIFVYIQINGWKLSRMKDCPSNLHPLLPSQIIHLMGMYKVIHLFFQKAFIRYLLQDTDYFNYWAIKNGQIW